VFIDSVVLIFVCQDDYVSLLMVPRDSSFVALQSVERE